MESFSNLYARDTTMALESIAKSMVSIVELMEREIGQRNLNDAKSTWDRLPGLLKDSENKSE